jgi:hypothetical protein
MSGVNSITSQDWESPATGEIAAASAPSQAWNEKLVALRDTLIVLGMQVSFRVAMFLRHLNY